MARARDDLLVSMALDCGFIWMGRRSKWSRSAIVKVFCDESSVNGFFNILLCFDGYVGRLGVWRVYRARVGICRCPMLRERLCVGLEM